VDGREGDPIGRRPEPAGHTAERPIGCPEPTVRHRLFDQDAAPVRVSLRQRGTGRGLQHVPGRLHGREERFAVDPLPEAADDRLGLLRTARGEPEDEARLPDRAELIQQLAIVEHTALDGGGMDLVEREVIAEEPPRLRDLPSERGDREILHLLDVGVEPPSAQVGVSPLRSDHDLRTIPGVEPSTEERLGIAVGSRDVHVPDARGVRRIEDLPTPSLHRRSGAFAPEVAISANIDVDGAPERGQAESDPRGHEPGLSEGTDLHIGKLAPSEQGWSAPPTGSTTDGCDAVYAFSFA